MVWSMKSHESLKRQNNSLKHKESQFAHKLDKDINPEITY